MGKLSRRANLPVVGLALVVIAALAGACSTGPEVGSEGSPGPTPIDDIADVSLAPASEGATPEAVESTAALPSTAPPSGEPSAAPLPGVDYTFGADDAAAFADAYTAAFASAELDEETIDLAGARLCTYLMRHADAAGVVALEDALIEADINEPGFARADWLTAFEVANAHYCGEFTVDFESAGA
jgi:hypothetical protein